MFRNRYTLSILTLLIVFTVIASYKSLAGFFDDSMDFDKGAVAAWWSSDVSDSIKVEHCSIVHEHNTYSGCEDGQAHFISERWVNQPEKIIVTGTAKYEGNGYVRFRSTGGQISQDGEHYTTLTSRTTAGEPAGSFPSLKKRGKPGKEKPVYTLVRGTGTVRSTVYSLDPPTDYGSYTLTVNSGDALGDGFEASGGAYVEISMGGSITGIDVTGTIGATVEWSKGRESTNTGILSKSWSWNVRKTAECDAHAGDFFISSPHDHHWTCPTSNGCGKHITCGVPESNISDEHKLHATCWNSGNGCTETNVRKCTHDCSYDNDSANSGNTGSSNTMLACGVHSSGTSGDHSLQASCSSTDSNGNSCTVTSFYACSSHTHSYPSPPPPPTTVACGGASYTGCSGASSRTEHHVPSCSHCNNGYWTCGQYAYRHTTQNTCRRPGCGVTYYECQNGTCTSDWGTNSSHWAQ